MKKMGMLAISAALGAVMLTGCCSHTFTPATCEEPEISRLVF